MSSKTHIVFTVTNDLTYDRRMLRICNALTNHGFQISIVGFKKKVSLPLHHKKYKENRLSLFFKSGKLFYVEYNFKLFFYLIKYKFDVYCAIDLDTVLAHYLASIWRKKPLILDAHELYLGLPEIQHRPITKWIWTRLEKWIYPSIKKGYTVCESIAKIYHKDYGIDMKVIYNCPTLKPIIESKKDFILYQGALNEGRGLEELIKAMQWIKHPLKIAGSGDIDEKLQQLVQQLDLTNKISFLGYVKPVDLIQLTQKAFIGINLLKAYSLNYYYSLANKFFDYIHAEVPQISMNFPEYSRINKEYEVALLIDDLEPKDIANNINRLIENKTLYQRLSFNCSKAKKIYHWENETKKLIQFYQSLEA